MEAAMKLTGNTIFITGGGSGIGRGLAEALHKLGNQVIISGRRRSALEETTTANLGMQSVELDMEDPASIAAVAKKLIGDFPALNVLVNNAGIMKMDDVDGPIDDAVVASIVNTNLLGPLRMTSTLIEHLKKQPEAAVVYVTSGLAFTPLAQTATYCATKAAIHSFAMSQRYLLKRTNVKVLEIAPPYVQTELNGPAQASDPRAMPLQEFIDETMKVLGTDADEVLVERVKPLRDNPGPHEFAFVSKFNDMMEPRNEELRAGQRQ
jgi:uncharacterized oxidoreductase